MTDRHVDSYGNSWVVAPKLSLTHSESSTRAKTEAKLALIFVSLSVVVGGLVYLAQTGGIGK